MMKLLVRYCVSVNQGFDPTLTCSTGVGSAWNNTVSGCFACLCGVSLCNHVEFLLGLCLHIHVQIVSSRCKLILRWIVLFFVQISLSTPVLSEGELTSLQNTEFLKTATLPTFFDISDGIEGALQRGLDKLCEAADAAVRSGSQLLILSDRTDNLVGPST